MSDAWIVCVEESDGPIYLYEVGWIYPWEKEHHVPDEIQQVVKRGYEKWASE